MDYVVVDAKTGEPLAGEARDTLHVDCANGRRAAAYFSRTYDAWCPVASRETERTLRHLGYSIREVRVVAVELIVERILDNVCALVNECQSRIENRNEAAGQRAVADYYGGDGPQTLSERAAVSVRP